MGESDERRRLMRLMLDDVQRRTATVTLMLLLYCTVLTVLFHATVPRERLIPWVISFLLMIAVRAGLVRRRGRLSLEDPEVVLVQRRRSIIVLSSWIGLLQGALAWVAFPVLDLPERVILTFMVIHISEGASNSIADVPAALLLLRITSILPFAVAWAVMPSAYQVAAPSLLFAFLFIWFYLGRRRAQAEQDKWALVARNERLAQELTLRNQELQESDATKNRLFAVAGHDLRQPVHAIGLTVAQLRQDLPPAAFNEHMNRLRQATYLASDMLQDLMDFSNLERKDFTAHPEDLPLAPLIEQVRLSLEPLARARQLRLSVSSRAELLAVRSDPLLLRRILLNLVSNGIRYTERGSVHIDCTAVGDEVWIRVEDTGIGIASEHLRAIFDDYVRLGEQPRKDDGLGLGLSVVRRAADLLGHGLHVTSTPGGGSVFEVRVKAAPLPPAAALTQPAPLSSPLPHGEVVLVVEDDQYVRDALKSLLAEWGFDPRAGASAREALSGLGLSRPAIIITDYQLSAQEDGLDCIGLVREHMGDPHLPALLMTGDINPALKPRAAAAGVSVAHKPIPPPVLRQRIRALLAEAAN